MSDARREIEWRVLRALCKSESDSLRMVARRRLAGYNWVEPLHEAIFKCLMDLPSASRDDLQPFLPALLTRRGFPDVNWDELFLPPELPEAEIERLIAELAHPQ